MDAAMILSGSEVFVLKMPSVRIGDLVVLITEELANLPEAIATEMIIFQLIY